MEGDIVVDGELTCCVLLHSVCDLKVAQMNMKCSLILELMLCKFKLVQHGMVEAAKKHFLYKKCSSSQYSDQIMHVSWVYDIKLHLMVRLQSWSVGKLEYPFITITLRFTLTRSGSTS